MNFKIQTLLILVLIFSFSVESRRGNILTSTNKSKITRRHLIGQYAGINNPEANGTRVTKTCLNDDVFMITGAVLKITDIPLQKDIKCSTQEGSETKIVELFATEKVIIDGNIIETGGELTFVIIAPTWEVIGSREIILDGAAGKRHYPPKAEKGNIKRDQMLHGKSGLPGGNGGNFYGIGRIFINSENLLISANGGNGGSGQDGGDGADGIDGITYSVDEGLDGLEKPIYTVQNRSADYDPPGTKTIHFTVNGKNGTSGHTGGNGGSAGKPGKKGIIKIISLSSYDQPSFVVSTVDGSEGLPGAGGKGGRGGLNARTVKFTYQSIQSWPYYSPVEELGGGSAPAGEDGKAGESRLGFRFQHKEKTDFDLVEAVNDFKFYATWHLSNNSNKDFRNFFAVVRGDKTIRNSYRTSGYVQEFYYLEVLCFHLKKKAHLIPFYRSLKDRLEEYSKHREGEEQIREYEKILEELYDDVSERIAQLLGILKPLGQYRHSLSPEFYKLWIKLTKYIYPEVKSTIKMRDSERLLKMAYKFFWNTMNLIGRENQEKLDVMKDNIDERISRLVANGNKSESTELSNLITERFSLECFYFTNLQMEFSGFLAALAYLSEAHNTLLYRREYRDPPYMPAFSVPEELQEVYQEIQRKSSNYVSKRVAIIRGHEAYVREKKSLMSSTGFDALQKLEDSLAQLCRQLSSTSWINDDPFEMELNILSIEEKILLIERKKQTSSVYQIPLEVIQHLKSESQLARILGDSYERFSKLQVTGLFTETVSERETDFDNLKSKREDLTRLLLPITLTLRTQMGITGDSIPGVIPAKNPYRQDRFSGWNIQLIFKVLENALDSHEGRWTKFLPVFKAAVKELQIMELFLSDYVYSKKYPYDEIKGITSNDDLTYKWACLNFYKERNDILYRFRELSTYYRMLSFPRVEYFKRLDNVTAKLKNKTLAREELFKGIPKFNETIVGVKLYRIRRICDIMKDKLYNSKTSTVLSDNFERFIYLNDSFKDSFYVWKNKFYNAEIFEFLSGKEVRLTSNAGSRDLNAVKYRLIGIEITSENKTVQTEVDKVLENFNITLTHLGDSHYKCDDDVYVIKSDVTSFTYNYENLQNMLEDNYTDEFLLSPYATYSLKLEDVKKASLHSLSDFGSLEKFKSLVDIRLIGKGIFLGKNRKVKCESNLNQFYRRESDLEEPEFVRDLEIIV